MENKTNLKSQTQAIPSDVSLISTTLDISIPKTPKDWADSLADVGFNSIQESKDSLSVSKFHSYSISGAPRHYSKIKFSKNSLTLEYTVDSSQNPTLRSLEAANLALHSLSCLGSITLTPKFCAYLYSSLENAISLISPQNANLEHQNSKMKTEISLLNEKIAALYAQREKDSKRAYSDSVKIAQLEDRLSKLSAVSDSHLDELVLNWLTTHDGELSVLAFCQNHPVPSSRLEHSLERLCRACKIKGV